LHDENEEELKPRAAPPEVLDAKEEIFLRTWVLPQRGQVTSSWVLELRSNSSKDWLQAEHLNSNNGMAFLVRWGWSKT
jgi:hypothetical protein